jgi:hypothetical protein
MLEMKKFNCAAVHVRRSDFIFLDQRAVCFVTIRLIGIAGTFFHSPNRCPIACAAYASECWRLLYRPELSAMRRNFLVFDPALAYSWTTYKLKPAQREGTIMAFYIGA